MSDPARWRIFITSRAERELKRLPPRDQARIRRGVDSFVKNPAQSDVKKLRGMVSIWRLRAGHWRVFFTYEPHEHAIYILSILHRREAYRA